MICSRLRKGFLRRWSSRATLTILVFCSKVQEHPGKPICKVMLPRRTTVFRWGTTIVTTDCVLGSPSHLPFAPFARLQLHASLPVLPSFLFRSLNSSKDSDTYLWLIINDSVRRPKSGSHVKPSSQPTFSGFRQSSSSPSPSIATRVCCLRTHCLASSVVLSVRCGLWNATEQEDMICDRIW
jgi:hypothetical protein